MKRKESDSIFENRQRIIFELKKDDITEGQIITNGAAGNCPSPILFTKMEFSWSFWEKPRKPSVKITRCLAEIWTWDHQNWKKTKACYPFYRNIFYLTDIFTLGYICEPHYLLRKMGRVKSTTSALFGVIITPVMATSASRLARTPTNPFHDPFFKTDPENLSSGSWYSVLREKESRRA